MNIILYSTSNCGQCAIAKQLLVKKGVKFETCEDIEQIQALGIQSVPCLNVDGNLIKNVIKWVNELS